jgi:hypothetical protein
VSGQQTGRASEARSEGRALPHRRIIMPAHSPRVTLSRRPTATFLLQSLCCPMLLAMLDTYVLQRRATA